MNRMSNITLITSSCVSLDYEGREITIEYELKRDELDDIYSLVIPNKAVDLDNAEVALKWTPEDYSAVLKRIRYYNFDKNITV